jgi:DNA primase
MKAAHRAAHLALPHLKAGYSLRFAFLPNGEDPDSYIAHNGAGAMSVLLEAALPLSQLLWRIETEGKDFSTPERRAGLEHSLKEIVERIGDAKVADYYRRGFEQLIFENFKRRSAQPRADRDGARYPARSSMAGAGGPGGKFRGDFRPRPALGSPEAVSASVQSSALVRSGPAGARQAKELELGRLMVESPEIVPVEAESLACLDVADPSLDRLRRELLNLAASGSSLEKAGVQAHFVRKGMADLLARFAGNAVEDPLASFQRAMADLRELSGHRDDARRLLERRKERFQRPGDGRGQ